MTVQAAIAEQKYPPQDYDKYVVREGKVLLLFERIGQVTVTTAAVIFTVIAFFLLAIYGRNWVLGVAVVFLGIGHIGIHAIHKKEVEQELREST